MKKNSNNIKIIISCLALVFLTVILTTGSAWANRHNIPGVSCQAYNNAQANELQRSHVRLLNPSTNNRSIWVVCGMPRNMTDITDGLGLPNGWYDIYFSAGVTQSATCIFREFDAFTVHVPGGTPDPLNTRNVVTTIIPPPLTLPGYTERSFALTDADTDINTFYTVTCLLPPGTGIQNIPFDMD